MRKKDDSDTLGRVRVLSGSSSPRERANRSGLMPLLVVIVVVLSVAALTRSTTSPTPSAPPPGQLAEGDPEANRRAASMRNAEALLMGYLTALDQRDLGSLAASLQPDGVFMVPSLGDAVHDWHDQPRGQLDIEAIAATLAFLDNTDTAIAVSECSSRTAPWGEDRVTTVCDFEVGSALLEQHGIESDAGSVTAMIADGSIESVHLDRGPSIELWQRLEPLPAVDDWLTRVFEPTDAARHLASLTPFQS